MIFSLEKAVNEITQVRATIARVMVIMRQITDFKYDGISRF
jgi:hypothetical protein